METAFRLLEKENRKPNFSLGIRVSIMEGLEYKLKL